MMEDGRTRRRDLTFSVAGASQRLLRNVGWCQEATLRLLRLTEAVGVGVDVPDRLRPGLLRRPSRQQRYLIHDILHLVTERRLGRRRKRRTRFAIRKFRVRFALAVLFPLVQRLVAVAIAELALIAGLHDAEGTAALQVASEALALVRQQGRFPGES